MIKFRDDLEQGTAEWLEWRKGGMGGSDISAMKNINPDGYKTRRDLFMQKAGLKPSETINSYAAHRGHKTEAALRKMYLDQLGIDAPPTCVEFDDILFVSLDGYNKDFGVVEFKQVGKEVFEEIQKGIVPPHHLCQVQAGMKATNSKKGLYCAGYYKKEKGKEVLESCSVEIVSDIEMQDEIIKEIVEFNLALKSMDIPPMTSKDTLQVIDEDLKKKFYKLEKLKRLEAKIKKKYNDIKLEVIDAADHNRVDCDGIKMTRVTKIGSINYAEIPNVSKMKPETLEKYRKPGTTSVTFTFRKEKKK